MPPERIIKRRLLPAADEKALALKPVCLHLMTLEANNKVDGVTDLVNVQPVTRIEAKKGRCVALVCSACECQNERSLFTGVCDICAPQDVISVKGFRLHGVGVEEVFTKRIQ